MSAPLKSKLSYAWARATKKGRIYSHVFEKKVSIPVLEEFSNRVAYHTPGKVSRWLKAVEMEGQPGQFLIYQAFYQTHRNWGVSGRGDYYEDRFSGVYTRAQAQQLIKEWEVEQLKNSDALPAPKQPFKAFIKTRLAG